MWGACGNVSSCFHPGKANPSRPEGRARLIQPLPERIRVAVVHDWLTGMRGGENVLEGILELVPHAELFTLIHKRGSVSAAIESRPLHVSWVDRPARAAGDYRRLLPLFPAAIRSFDLARFDLVISSSHCVAKGVRVLPAQPHVSYCHTPMRYIWDRFDDYFPRRRPLLRAVASVVAPSLRRWDRGTADRVSSFVANSRFVASRIRKYYGRSSTVVHPFVADEFLDAPLPDRRDEFHLVISALVPYKRVALAIEAARVSGRRLIVIGDGPLFEPLRASAPPNVELLGRATRNQLIALLGTARSLILPGVEDFGITPLEAMALGTPVIALGDGGVLDSVSDGEHGVLVGEATAPAFADAMAEVERITWDRAVLRRRASDFSRGRFLERFGRILHAHVS